MAPVDARVQARVALRDAVTYWRNFLSRCIADRLETDRFEHFVPHVHAKHPLPPELVADFFLRPQPTNRNSLDPRIPPYIQVLSRLGYVNAAAILRALYKYSSSQEQLRAAQPEAGEGDNDEPAQKTTLWASSYWAEEVMFYHVIKMVIEGSAFKDAQAALDLAYITSKWMQLFTAASTAFATDMLGQMQESPVRHEMETSRAAFVPLLLRMIDHEAVLKALGKPLAKGVRKHLSKSLENFIPTLQPVPQVADKLELFRSETLARLDPDDKSNQATDAAVDALLDSAGQENFVIPEIPISNTRAGLYVYLNASLVGRPLIDDNALFSFLNNRYPGDTHSPAIDLILASFDVLATASFKDDGQKDAHLLRSYLINKVPMLLRQLCPAGFSATPAEVCITQALNQVDIGVFPTASYMFDENRNSNPYTESVREEFCSACALHGLVDRDHLNTILGEIPMSYNPSLEKYSKDKLVQNCLSDPEKIQGLVRELEKSDGNVGAICQALVELMRQLCNNKETMSLKLLCTQLAQKPLSLDVLLLFEKLPNILEPLCTLLDGWSYDDDQGEYQPVYEEFGAILLLVLAFVYRYNLSPSDIGIHAPGSRVAQIISRAHISRGLDELTEAESGHLGGWIQGLFDSETGGLGDDLMSSCVPQDFYLLIAPLFQNIVVAYANGYLNDESLKSGVEYLVDTFLLPSLVPAIRFLADYLWVDQPEQQKSIIKILQLILLPSSISGEASSMLTSVKNIVAKPLEHALRTSQARDPKNNDIEPLLQALKESIPLSRRDGSAQQVELEAWVNSSSSGLVGAVRHTVQALVQWSMNPGVNSTPAPYTHRQIIAAIRIAGPKRVLHVILEEIRQQSDSGNANIIYDVAAALVCAPDVTNEPPAPGALIDAQGNMRPPPQRPLTLRDILRSEAEDYRKTQKKEPVLAEAIVRLHRRVEAQMAVPPPQNMLPEADMALGLGDDNAAAAALGDAMAAAAGQGDGLAGAGNGSLDMGLGAGLDLGGPSADGGLDGSGDADIFAGLDNDIDMDMDVFNTDWDTMEL